jgi:lysophospholipase L1-like esterase
MAAFFTVFIHSGYHTKVLEKLGFCEPTTAVNTALTSWEYCLTKMNYEADAVFFGDSITAGNDFGASFPDLQVVNMGISGDTISGMTKRIPAVQLARPGKVFILGGINSLNNNNIDQEIAKYAQLVSKLKEALPNTQIYVQSILPVSPEQETALNCQNATIREFNRQLQELASKYGSDYIDLYSLYAQDGKINPEMTPDGLHLNPEAYCHWEDAIRQYIYAD